MAEQSAGTESGSGAEPEPLAPSDASETPEPSNRPPGLLPNLKRLLFGSPLSTSVQMAHRLPIMLALPVLASDALSSNAYATEEILHVLASAHRFQGGPPTLQLVVPISIAIAVMMFIIMASYRRAVVMYPQSGGSYTVTRRNLGATAGLIAGSALFIDYILTVAVSVSAGIAAVTSYAPALLPWRVWLSVALILLIAWINLRGTRESGWTFALPAYTFAGMMTLMLGMFFYRYFTGQIAPLPMPDGAVEASQGLGVFLILKAFSNGCAALTGVEAISNGVQIFQPPESRNAAKTLLILITTSVAIFLGLGFAARVFHAAPTHAETLVSQLARATFLSGSLIPEQLGHVFFALTIGSVLAVLIVASNTAFADLPRLLATMARDGYAPRVLMGQGDRLVFNRGIYTLTAISALIVVAFQASVSSLIPLYAVGVFLCFTLSQAGMFRKFVSERKGGWLGAAALNGVGAAVTGIVMLVIAATKFQHGAWVVVLLIPALVLTAFAIKRHYQWFENRLAVYGNDVNPLRRPGGGLSVLVLISSDVHKGTLEGLEVARSLTAGRPDADVRALHVELNAARTKQLLMRFSELVEPHFGDRIRLDVIASPYRWLIEPVMEYIDALQEEKGSRHRLVVLLPEFETGSRFSQMLHNNSASGLRKALMQRPNVTIITNRFFMREGPREDDGDG